MTTKYYPMSVQYRKLRDQATKVSNLADHDIRQAEAELETLFQLLRHVMPHEFTAADATITEAADKVYRAAGYEWISGVGGSMESGAPEEGYWRKPGESEADYIGDFDDTDEPVEIKQEVKHDA